METNLSNYEGNGWELLWLWHDMQFMSAHTAKKTCLSFQMDKPYPMEPWNVRSVLERSKK